MKSVLIITSYYPPEMGAASNRIAQLSEGLSQTSKVTVLTPLPNYPLGKIFPEYKGKVQTKEVKNTITIFRLWIYSSRSKNKIIRLFSMFSYSLSIIWFYLTHKIPDKIIIQSPPLIVAFISILFLKKRKKFIVLNVSDLWPIAGLELGVFRENLSYRILKKIEVYNYNCANLILGQSNEILDHVKNVSSTKNTMLYRNFPNFNPPEIKETLLKSNITKFVYAGLLGVAQGILSLLENLEYNTYEFHIYGTGAEEEQIVNFISHNPKLPIYFHGSIDRDKLHKEIQKYDATIIPLVNRIYGSVPSKIFEFSRLGLPIIYFGGGEGEKIINDYELGWVVSPKNFEALNALLDSISNKAPTSEFRNSIKQKALTNFNIENQIKKLITKLQ